MSMIRCEKCGSMIDSDDDPDCFVPHPAHPVRGAPDLIWCEPCREHEQAELERAP